MRAAVGSFFRILFFHRKQFDDLNERAAARNIEVPSYPRAVRLRFRILEGLPARQELGSRVGTRWRS